MKEELVDLFKNQKNKKILVQELQIIYQLVLDNVEDKKNTNSNTEIEKISESLKNENIQLKQYIKNIDKKFDYIIKENKELKDYIKSKTDDYESNMHEIVNKLHEEIKFFNDHNANSQNSLKKSSNINKNQSTNHTFKNNTNYKESPLSNHDYNENIVHTEGTESNKNKLILAGEDSKEYDLFNSNVASPKIEINNDLSNLVYKNIIKDEEKISLGAKKLDKKIIENINKTISHNLNNNFGFTLNFNNNSFKEIVTPMEDFNTNSNNCKNFALNLENIPHKDFNDEFLEKIEEFSPSWRAECRKLKGLRVEKKK